MIDQQRYAETAAMAQALRLVFHQDHSNAAMHCAPVRYSPLTFRLAEALRSDERQQDLAEGAGDLNTVARVLAELGTYPEDTGR